MKSLAEAPTMKKGMLRVSAALFTMSRASTVCGSIFPDKLNNILLIDHFRCFYVSLVSCCQKVCINKDWMHQVIIFPLTGKYPKSCKNFNIPSRVSLESVFDQQFIELVSLSIDCYELRF